MFLISKVSKRWKSRSWKIPKFWNVEVQRVTATIFAILNLDHLWKDWEPLALCEQSTHLTRDYTLLKLRVPIAFTNNAIFEIEIEASNYDLPPARWRVDKRNLER